MPRLGSKFTVLRSVLRRFRRLRKASNIGMIKIFGTLNCWKWKISFWYQSCPANQESLVSLPWQDTVQEVTYLSMKLYQKARNGICSPRYDKMLSESLKILSLGYFHNLKKCIGSII